MGVAEIIIEVKDVGQLLVAPGSLFYGRRMLSPDAEEVIIEESAMAPSKDQIHLKIHLRNNETSRKDEIAL